MEDKFIHLVIFIISFLKFVISVNTVENITINTTSDSLITITTTTTTSNARIYLVRGDKDNIFDEDAKAPILQEVSHDSHESDRKTQKKREGNSTTQIYIIAVIGVAPAAIGALMWWIRNLKRKCIRGKAASKRSQKSSDANTPNPFLINDIPIDQITYKVVQRAEKLNDSNALWYNSYKPSYFVKSRRVYSLEISRKNLDMIEILGEGNFGQVWKARAVQIGKSNKSSIVAIKTNKINTSEKDSEDLLKELDIMLQLGTHPNVVRLLGCCTENEPYFLIMEYVSNGKLLSYLRSHRTDRTYYNNNYNNNNNNNSKIDSVEKTISSADLVLFAYQISKGMEFISSHGIIHRDLAARNVLIDGNKNCKVADFGLSRSIRDKESDMYEQKTGGEMPIRWMSPESLTMGLFSTKSDVWAYGILIWEITTLGSTPYIGLSAQEVIKFIIDGHIIERPEHCNNDFYALMKSCWAYDCEQRLTFTQLRMQLSKMIESQCGYVDLQHFNDNLYYNLYSSPGEKV